MLGSVIGRTPPAAGVDRHHLNLNAVIAGVTSKARKG
jgi:hypothetical protein